MKPYKLNLKRIIDTATRLEGKKESISRAQMSKARRCVFAAIDEELRNSPIGVGTGQFYDAVMSQAAEDGLNFYRERIAKALEPCLPKPARRRHK